jgi:GH35 family endo-1,4-beta-xylanase
MAEEANPLDAAQDRIQTHRKGEILIRARTRGGSAAPGRRLRIEQQGHKFLFGCNIFLLDPNDDGERQRLYQERFCDLLNYATLPFYWSSYEAAAGRTQQERLCRMAEWCVQNGIRPKGHPLVWHETWPQWAPKDRQAAVPLIERRVRDIVARFKGLIDWWDIINESTVSQNYENGVGDWVRTEGCAAVAAACLRWAREENPQAVLLVNDYNVSPAYESQIADLSTPPAGPDAIGIQSHMHCGEWPLRRVWEVCETYARFGLPLHFTETTVLSGRLIPPDVPFNDANWDDWPSTAEGEARQLKYLEGFYTLLFSHPAVRAVTWWDLSDGCWKKAPAGLVRRDLSAKPAYERLRDLVQREWKTRETTVTDKGGEARIRGFYGSYVLQDAGGTSTRFDHEQGAAPTTVTLTVE